MPSSIFPASFADQFRRFHASPRPLLECAPSFSMEVGGWNQSFQVTVLLPVSFMTTPQKALRRFIFHKSFFCPRCPSPSLNLFLSSGGPCPATGKLRNIQASIFANRTHAFPQKVLIYVPCDRLPFYDLQIPFSYALAFSLTLSPTDSMPVFLGIASV